MNNNYSEPLPYEFDMNAITSGGGRGNRACSIHNILKNKNWLGGPAQTPVLNDGAGLVFITKPDMNLTLQNIAAIRELSPLTTNNRYALGSAMRDMLDSRTAWMETHTELNDPEYPFLGILDNTCTSLDGWPDYVMDEFVSEPGKGGSTYAHAKGRIKKAQKFDLSMVHRNLPGDAINYFYTVNSLYQELVHRWKLSPHSINVRYNRLDYTMRIYRFALDSTGTRLNQFTMCGYGFPKAGSQGAVMSYSTDEGINTGYDTVSASWSCVGMFHNDPIVVHCFNATVVRFNPTMADSLRERFYVRVGHETNVASFIDIKKFQYFGYPRINPKSLEFEVWVDKGLYKSIIGGGITDDVINTIRYNTDHDMGERILRAGANYANKIFTK